MRVIEDSPRGRRTCRRGEGCFRFVRRKKEEEEEEKEGHVRHCSGSLNAKNRKFKRVDGKRVERTNEWREDAK